MYCHPASRSLVEIESCSPSSPRNGFAVVAGGASLAVHRTVWRASKDERPRCRRNWSSVLGAFVYMLQCADGSYYVGSATGDDLWKRLTEHETGSYPVYASSGASCLVRVFRSYHRRDCSGAQDQGMESREKGSVDPRRLERRQIACKAASRKA